MSSSEKKYLNINNRIIDKYFYCVCFCDELIPQLRSKDINDAIAHGNFMEILLKKKYYKKLDPCLKHYAVIEDIFSFETDKLTENEKQVYVKMCIDDNTVAFNDGPMFTNQKMTAYCECLVSEMMKMGYTYAHYIESFEGNSEAFHEIALPCINEEHHLSVGNLQNTRYVPEDILGDADSTTVNLLDFLGHGYKVKISIDGVARYYLFDTGASTLTIDKETERELLLNGSLTKEDYQGVQSYILANNVTVEARLIELNNVEIGDYTLNHVDAAILEDGTLLCGISLLNKFKTWEIDIENKILILYK